MVRDAADYTPPDTTAQQPALRDYESYALGESERSAHVGQEGAVATVAVTDETAVSGKHSLKVAEHPGVKLGFVPYITYPLEMDEGTLHGGFSLKLEQGADFVYEWRDDPYQYNLGPNLHVAPDGWLAANGKRLVQVPLDKWLRFDVICPLGDHATGTYDLKLQVENEPVQDFADVACSDKFKYLNCIVVMSVGTDEGSFYLDDMEFRPQ